MERHKTNRFGNEKKRARDGRVSASKWGHYDADLAAQLQMDADTLPAPVTSTYEISKTPIRPPELDWRRLHRIPMGYNASSPEHAQSLIAGNDERVLQVIDDLRTQLLQTLQIESWKRIAITAPTSGCGATFTAVQLALSISRIPDFRTVLIDLNQRSPHVARTLGLRRPGDVHAFLSGYIDPEDYLVRCSETLALGLNDAKPIGPSEILHSRHAAEALGEMINTLNPDVILYDLPPMLEYDDLAAFLPQVDGVLLVVDASKTLATQIEECERRLSGKTSLLGVILNRSRSTSGTALAA